MILDHLSTNLLHDGHFKLGVPEVRLESEDNTIKRVCSSSFIEGCLSAMPKESLSIDELIEEQYGYFKVFKIDTEKLGISEQFIIKPDALYKNDFVRDAEETQEHWITKEFTVPKEDSYFIRINRWEEEGYMSIPYKVLEKVDSEYDGDIEKAYYDIIGDDYIPTYNKVIEVEYSTNLLKENEEFILYDVDDYIDSYVDFIEKNTNLEMVKISEYELIVKARESTDITDLMLFDLKTKTII